LPVLFRVVDAPVEPLGVIAHRVRHAQHDELALDQREQRIVEVAGGDRHVLAEAKGVELVDPGVIARLDAARVGDVLELRSWERVKSPAFGAVLARGLRTVERALALAAVEAREMSARERGPEHALAIDVAAARPVARQRRL